MVNLLIRLFIKHFSLIDAALELIQLVVNQGVNVKQV